MKSPTTNELQPYSYLTICLKPWIIENMEGAELQFCSSEQNRRCRTTKFNRSKSNIFEDTDRENAPSNKTPALTERMNMDIWVICASNELFTRGS